MSTAYHATVFLHVLSAIVWLGGMIAFALLAPILRGVGDEGARQGLFQRLGERFRIVGWLCLSTLMVTGLVQMYARGWWGAGVLGSARFWGTPVGAALAWKLVVAASMLGVQAVHDFWMGPRAGRVRPGTTEARALRRRAAILARVNAVLAPVLVWFAVALARGG